MKITRLHFWACPTHTGTCLKLTGERKTKREVSELSLDGKVHHYFQTEAERVFTCPDGGEQYLLVGNQLAAL